MRFLSRWAALLLLFQALSIWAADGLLAQKEYEPKGGKGRVVVLVSGQSGPTNYADLAKSIADEGYYVVLVDGNDFWLKGGAGEGLLKGVIQRAQASPYASAGKVGVVGCSLGGGSALAYAARMPSLVGAVVAHYPLTNFITDAPAFVGKIRVPSLLLAGTFDTYKNCCTIEKARELDSAAKGGPEPRLLTVHEYPGVDHGFSTDTTKRRDIKADSLRRTSEHLRLHLTDG